MMPFATINGTQYEMSGDRIHVSIRGIIHEFAIPSPVRCAELAEDCWAAREFWGAVAKRAYGGQMLPIGLDYAGQPDIRR
jgi:hypothetical protein